MSGEQNEVPVESTTFQQPTNGTRANAKGSAGANGQASAQGAPRELASASSAQQQETSADVDKKIELFQIHVESNPRNTLMFVGGDVVKGTIVMTLKEALEVENLDLNLVGGSTVGWKQAVVGQAEAIEKHEIEYYINEQQNILGILPGENLLVSKGTHKFRFHFLLPPNLPATFQGEYGNVNYILKATLKAPLGTNIYVTKVQVQQYLDTPNYLKFLSPAEVRIKKHYAGRGIKSMVTGPVEAVFAVTRMGFTFGEPIEINGHVLNRSHALVTSIEANLVQRCIYIVKEARISEARVTKKVEDVFEVQHNSIRRWKDVKLVVPEDCSPSYLENCKLIETFYELAFVVNVKGAKPLVATLPIVIGLGSLQHTAKAEVDRQRTSAPVSTLGTLRTQIFDYGTITSAALPRNGNGAGDEMDAARPDEQRKAQRQSQGESVRAEVNRYDDTLE